VIRGIAWGVIVMAVGAWIWLAKLHPESISGPVFPRDWPLIIVVAGLMSIVDGIAGATRRRK
jgi:hypothetical protein